MTRSGCGRRRSLTGPSVHSKLAPFDGWFVRVGVHVKKTMMAVAFAGAVAAGAAFAQVPAAPPGGDANLTDAQKLDRSAQSLERMRNVLKQVLGRVEEARNEKDVVKLNCVNEKLTQIKGLLKVAEQSDLSLHEDLANKDPNAESEFAKIGIARNRIDALRADSEQCIGQLAYVIDEKTTVEVQQPTDLPGRGATEGFMNAPPPPPAAPVVYRPVSASTYLP